MSDQQTIEGAFRRVVPRIEGLSSALLAIDVVFVDGQIKFVFQDEWFKKRVAKEYLPRLGRELASEEVQVGFVCSVAEGTETHSKNGKKDETFLPGLSSSSSSGTRHASPDVSTQQKQRPKNLNPDFAFQNFVVGDTNRVAYDAIFDLANWPGNSHELSPLLITGGTSSGKTHLLQAAAWHASQKRHSRVVYVTANGFAHHFFDYSFADNRAEKTRFRELYYNADFLIVDDLHGLAGKDKTEIEFRNICDSLVNRGGLLLMSSVPTSEALQFRAEVYSRASGMSVEIRQPEFDLRVAIVAKKAELYGVPLPGDLSVMIAERLGLDIRKLEGGVKLLKRFAEKYQRTIDEGLLNELFGSKGTGREGLTIAEIQRVVADHLEISERIFGSTSRRDDEVYARDCALYLCKRLLGTESRILARAFNRDRTWVDTAFDRAQKRTIDDPHHFKKDVEALTEILNNS